MDNDVGMVAVVQGLRGSGLAVTLLEGGRQYTLMPQTGTIDQASQKSQNTQCHIEPNHSTQKQSTPVAADTTLDAGVRRDSSIQATDGRYASTYQTSHCNVMPTSPPVQLSEFPPQKAELYPGHGNFEVGGFGSGERTYSPTRTPGCYRGSMSWPDKGAVCSPRSSHEPDAFANSLRKYPMLERSSEIVERLINYTQSKNISKNQSRYISPVRSRDSATSNQMFEHNSLRNNNTKTRYVDSRPKSRADGSPTKDMRIRNEDVDYRRAYYKDVDVRYVKEVPARFNENMHVCTNGNSMNIETQASVHMVSREVATAPRADSSNKNVAVLSPCTSNTFQKIEGAVSQQLPVTSPMGKDKSTKINFKSIQTTSSTINLLTNTHNCKCTAAEDVRRSKSEELKDQHIQQTVLEVLSNFGVKTKDTAHDSTKEEILKGMCMKLQRLTDSFDQNNNKDNIVFNLRKILRDLPVWIPITYDLKAINELSGALLNNTKKSKKKPEVFRAELDPLIKICNEEDNIEDVVKDWVNDIPIKNHDFVGKPVERLQVTDALVRKLLRLFSNKSRYYDIPLLKRKIINMIKEAPLDMSAYKKHHLMIKLVDSLITKIKDVSPHVLKKSNSLEAITNRYNDKTGFVCTTNKIPKPSEEELRELFFKELEVYKEKCQLNISSRRMSEIIAELVDIFTDCFEDIRFDYNSNLKEEIVMFLSYTGLFSSQQAKYFATHLLGLFKTDVGQTKAKWHNRNFVVLDNTLETTGPNATLNESSRIGEITQSDIDVNLDAYVSELCHQIDKWLTSLPVNIPQVSERGLRQDVINDLAGDIVDRHRFLALTTGHKESESDELEHLKYQIFKWIKKLVGEEQKETIDHAPDLMRRIRNIPVPMLTTPYQNINAGAEQKQPAKKLSYNASINSSSKNISRVPVLNPVSNIVRSNQTIQRDSLGSHQVQSSCKNRSASSHKSMKDLNEEYDEFVKDWVQKIPIPVTNFKEKEQVEKARMGIYNGIWKAVTKLKFDPVIFHNQFYYQDMLDNEIEKLLDALPKTDDLDAKKHSLKVKLIEKTTDMNEMLKRTVEQDSFKQQLVENIVTNIPRQTDADDVEDPMKLAEELYILNIAENYILNTKYKDEDKFKADVYRKKLLSNIKIFVDELKKTHGQELKDIDPGLYLTDILNALCKVPVPSEETIKQEADEILLGIEIEQWLNDLPIVSNDNDIERLQRRRLRDILAKNIHEIQQNSGLSECAINAALKHEISRFLRKMPLQKNESFNINFMVDELINRIKNKEKESRKKSVTFQELPSYDQFGQEMLHCSSFIAESAPTSYQPSRQFQSNASGLGQYHPIHIQEYNYAPSIIVGGGLANMSGSIPDMSASLSQGYMTFDKNRPVSSSLHDGEPYIWRYVKQSPASSGNKTEPVWYTLEETKNPLFVQQPIQTQQNLQQQNLKQQISQQQNLQQQNLQQYQASSGNGNQLEPVLLTLENAEPLHYVQLQPVQTQQYQSPLQYQVPQQYENIYLDGTNGCSNHTNIGQNPVSVRGRPDYNIYKPKNETGIQNYQSQNILDGTNGRPNHTNIGQNLVSVHGRPDYIIYKPKNDTGIQNYQSQNILDGTNGRPNHTNIGQNLVSVHGSADCNMYKPQNDSGIRNYQSLALATSQIATGHAGNQLGNQNGVVKINSIYPAPTAPPEIINVSQGANNICSPQRQSILMPTHTQMVGNKSLGHISSNPVTRPFLQTMSCQVPSSPRVTTNEYGSLSQTINSMPEVLASTGEQAVAYNQCAPQESNDGAIRQNANTQQYASSYGQPQGFSTPNQDRQGMNRDSPPRVAKKRGKEINRTRTGLTRRRLELDDSETDETDEEGCYCFEHMGRRRGLYCEEHDMDYCYMPVPFPCPYFF